jgi:hypothetical protein
VLCDRQDVAGAVHAKLVKDFQALLKEFQAAQQTCLDREAMYKPHPDASHKPSPLVSYRAAPPSPSVQRWKKLRIGLLRFGTGRRKWPLNGWTNPKRSRRTCTCEYGLRSWQRGCGGRRETATRAISHRITPIRNFFFALRRGRVGAT